MLQYQQINTAANWIQSAVQYLHDAVQIINDLGGQDYADQEAALKKDFLPSLLSSLDANSQLAQALQSLWQVGEAALTPKPSADANGAMSSQVIREAAFSTLAAGVGAYLTYLRMRLQWQAAVETQDPPKSGSLLYDYFDKFRLETDHWINNLSQRLIDMFSDRKEFVLLWPVPGNGHATLVDFFYLGKTKNIAKAAKVIPTQGDDFPNGQYYRDQIAAFVQAVTGPAFDAQFANERGMIDGFKSALDGWNSKMIPPKPANSAAPDADLTKWGADAPQGANWVAGASVRYAVRYTNPAGHSDGEWGAETVISTRAFPLVTDLPVDALNLATARHLRRQFKPAGGDWSSEQIVAIIPDNTTSAHLDNHP
jgi:hypothetical protein